MTQFVGKELLALALSQLAAWYESVSAQKARHVYSLLPVLYRFSGQKQGKYSEADDKAFLDEFMRVPGANPSMPYFDPFSSAWLPAGYAHSNVSTFRKNTFMNRWKAVTWEGDDIQLSDSVVEIFVKQALTKANKTNKIPGAALTIWFSLVNDSPLLTSGGSKVGLASEVGELRSRLQAMFGLSNEDWIELFDNDVHRDGEYVDLLRQAPTSPLADDELLDTCSQLAEEHAPANAPGLLDLGESHFDSPEELAVSLYLPTTTVEEMLWILERKRALLLSGPPGVGKSHVARALAAFIGPDSSDYVQFHPSYGYEYFVSGFRPAVDSDEAGLKYVLETGALLSSIQRANADFVENPANPRKHVLVIDEINRANVSAVFGELLTALEYRGEAIRLQYGSAIDSQHVQSISVPTNFYIIATMNNADRSVGNFDAALKRRFGTFSCDPLTEPFRSVLRKSLIAQHGEGLGWIADWIDELNDVIPDRDFAIGSSYFFGDNGLGPEQLARIIRFEIQPYLYERFGRSAFDAHQHLLDAEEVLLREPLAPDAALGQIPDA